MPCGPGSRYRRRILRPALRHSRAPDAQQIGVQQPATALTGPDPAHSTCRQTAPEVNWNELWLTRCNGWLSPVATAARFERKRNLAMIESDFEVLPISVVEIDGVEPKKAIDNQLNVD